MINGINAAKNSGCTTIAFTGQSGGQLKAIADHCVCVADTETARVQEGHILIGHWLCEALDEKLSKA